MNRLHDRPYWLFGGTEACAVCAQPYVLEMECRCVACDSGLCIHCVVRLRRTDELFCPDCHDAEEDV